MDSSSNITLSAVNPTTIMAVVGVGYVARSFWYSLPTWVKGGTENIPRGLAKDANDDLTNPSAIMEKLNDMFELTYKHCDDMLPDDMPQYKLYVCLVSFLHLLSELYVARPAWRDNDYREEGEGVDVEDLKNLAFYLELANDAYEESNTTLITKLRPMGYDLIRHDVATEPGRIGHFIAVSHERKEVVISMKGTSSLADVLTDLIGMAVPHTMSSGRVVRCHEGIYTATMMMLDDTEHIIKTFFQPAGYKVHLTGHSLGAAVACLLGVFLHENGVNVEVHAFATPPCLSLYDAMESRSYITSVVNNADVVPRSSINNLRSLNRLFLKIDEKLNARGLSPNDWTTSAAYIQDISKIDSELLMTPEELNVFQETARDAENGNDDYSLYVPGRVVCMWNCNVTAVPTEKKTVDCRQMHGSMNVLRQIEISTTMAADHACASYKTSLDALIAQAKGPPVKPVQQSRPKEL